MNRRHLIVSGLCFAGIPGCISEIGEEDEPENSNLQILVLNSQTDDSVWNVSVFVKNPKPHFRVLRDVEVYAYSRDGEKICQKEIGELNLENETVETNLYCQSPPMVIAGTVNESQCANTRVQIRYWTGPDDDLTSDDGIWDFAWEECSTALPPDDYFNSSG